MTFLEAAIEVLVQNKNQPMASREIWNKISELNLVNTLYEEYWLDIFITMVLLSTLIFEP